MSAMTIVRLIGILMILWWSRRLRFYTGSVVFAFEHMHQRRIIYREAQLPHSVQASLLLSLLPEPETLGWFGQAWPQVSGQSRRKLLMLGLLNLDSRAGCAMPRPRLETSLSRQKLTEASSERGERPREAYAHESLGRCYPSALLAAAPVCTSDEDFCADHPRKCNQAPHVCRPSPCVSASLSRRGCA